ncbi:hypothetical protein HID58_039575, partial [Brassica napus]
LLSFPSSSLMAFLRASTFLFLLFISVSSASTSERSSLLSFKASLETSPSPSPLSSWNLSSPSPCTWLGVTCRFGKVNSLSLPSLSLKGNLPPSLFSSLPFLTALDLSDNSLSGLIPPQLGHLKHLQTLSLSGNSLTGPLPSRLVGILPRLLYLDLSNNRLSGPLPPSFLLSFPALSSLDIPVSLWNSTNLMEFSASYNRLGGYLPPEIGNAVSLKRLVLSDNQLRGVIPREIGKLTSLSFLNLNSNELQGEIPTELGDCTSLTTLDLGHNNLQGEIPVKITALAQLQCLPSAYFHQTEMPDLSFLQHRGIFDLSHNGLTGPIPEELGDCVVVVEILLSNNHLSGEIPSSLSRLTNLTNLDLSGNSLTGSIPEELGHSPKLQGLNLANNHLSGHIPKSFGLLGSLVKLNLSKNNLDGSLPASLGNLKELTHMDLSFNKLTGELPSELSKMLNLVGIYIQQNRLSGVNLLTGTLPGSLGNLSYLTNLDLHQNHFTGGIPSELGSLMQLELLDVSENNISGDIPTQICGLTSLRFLNLAKNRLQGEVPSEGVCNDPSKALFSGNKALCGRVIGLDCKSDEKTLLSAWGLSGIVIGTMIIVLAALFSLRRYVTRRRVNDPEESFVDDQNLYFLSGSRSREPLSINVAMFEQPLLKVSLADIVEGTDRFCKKNIIGDGGFGTVYKACLHGGKTVAVKKLSDAKTQGNREFMAEMETLGKVKHPNLVSLIGYCSFSEEKLLVYEYMVNGSLDHWLRNQTGILDVLDWSKRLKIAVGAARGLAFLHHGFIPHIIHRDIKASNILLDSEFEPKVADFGLARLISACETHVSTIIAGTFGYIPPEYGQSARATTKGDVYSFGVILLELVTGKEPTGPDFKESEGGNLVGWVVQKINKGRAVDVLDPLVVTAGFKQAMLRVLQIAVHCIAATPASRPTMLDVLKSLKEL